MSKASSPRVSVTPGERTSTWSLPTAWMAAGPLPGVFCRIGLAAEPADASGSILAFALVRCRNHRLRMLFARAAANYMWRPYQGTERTRWNDGVLVSRGPLPGRAGVVRNSKSLPKLMYRIGTAVSPVSLHLLAQKRMQRVQRGPCCAR